MADSRVQPRTPRPISPSLFETALAAHAEGRIDDAIANYRRALSLVPNHAAAHNNLGNALLAKGDAASALSCYREAVRLNAAYSEAHYNSGLALQRLGRHGEAIEHYRQAVALEPTSVDAYNNWGNALQALGRYDEALARYESALRLVPDHVSSHYNAGIALAVLGRREEALAHYREVLSACPGHAEAHYSAGLTLAALRRYEDAIDHYRAAVAAKPDYAEAHNALGTALEALGRLGEASACFDAAIRHLPTNLLYYRNLFNCQKVDKTNPHLGAIEEIARSETALSAENRVQLHFALGKAYADIGRREASLAHLLEGNALHRRRIQYDHARELARLKRIRATFSRGFMRGAPAPDGPPDIPIFIVGMPRSGTSLVEQILASHPDVFGAGELLLFGACVSKLRERIATAERYPEFVTALSPQQIETLGENYRRRIAALAPGARHVTDKMPANFQFVGLIHLALPRAKIIHIVRDPVDTCVSCFSKLFMRGQPFTYDLRELGSYYRGYETLMRHWREVIPSRALIEVRYEDLVADVESESRRLLDHCGLPWNDACMKFYETQRAVPTASAAQVRQPIYNTSIGRWQRHRSVLRPLFDALEIEAPAMPAQSLTCDINSTAAVSKT